MPHRPGIVQARGLDAKRFEVPAHRNPVVDSAAFCSVVDAIVAVRRRVPPSRAIECAVSGIDASGKGFVSEQLRRELEARSLRVALLHVDDWQRFPSNALDPPVTPERFVAEAFDFDGLFRQVATHGNRDVVLIEGIFLLKRELRARFDLSIWIECPFDVGLARAVTRAQEGLPPEATRAAYRSLYYPAQELHIARDRPREAADVVLHNG